MVRCGIAVHNQKDDRGIAGHNQKDDRGIAGHNQKDDDRYSRAQSEG